MSETAKHHHDHQESLNVSRFFWLKSLFLGLIFLYFIVLNLWQPQGAISLTWHYGFWLPLTSYVIFYEGRHYFKIYYDFYKRKISMNALIGLSAHIIYLFSAIMALTHWNSPMYSYPQLWEAAGILIIVTNIGHVLEGKVAHSAQDAYQHLDQLINSHVWCLQGSRTTHLLATKVPIGATILVPKGELIPLDARVLSSTTLDYANITGEAKPITLKPGEIAIAGAYNLGESIRLVVTKDAAHSTLAKVVADLKQVEQRRPKMQQFADRILRFFVPLVLIIAVLGVLFYTIMGYALGWQWPWMSTHQAPWITGLNVGVGIMAIACPCALGIATPLVYAVSAWLLAKAKVMIHEPRALEELEKIKYFAFDKTGTITTNALTLVKIKGAKKYLPLAKGLEKNIKHPIADSIMTLPGKIAPVTHVKHLKNGLQGLYKTQKIKLITDLQVNELTNVALYVHGVKVLSLSFKNQVKPEVKATIKLLKNLKITPVMVTGDQLSVAQAVAQEVGIKMVFAQALPSEKAKIIAKLQKTGKVAFIGDGFNDTVAMKQANVSLAFASGSKITNSLADISLLASDFQSLLMIIKLAKMNNFRVRLAFAYAFGFNLLFIPIAMLFLVTPWMGAMIMALSDILVASNAFVYRRSGAKMIKKWSRQAKP